MYIIFTSKKHICSFLIYEDKNSNINNKDNIGTDGIYEVDKSSTGNNNINKKNNITSIIYRTGTASASNNNIDKENNTAGASGIPNIAHNASVAGVAGAISIIGITGAISTTGIYTVGKVNTGNSQNTGCAGDNNISANIYYF